MNPAANPELSSTLNPQAVHDLSGFLPFVRVASDVSIPVYFLVISVSFIIGLLWLTRRSRTLELPTTVALDLALVVMIAGFLGSRALHIFFEEPRYYFTSPLRVFEIWNGGFVWYGGALSGAAAGLTFLRIKNLPLRPWLDLFAPIAALGYALGRLACFFTGCCFGRVCTLASGFQFRYPTQAFAVIWELGAMSLLLVLEKRREARLRAIAPGQIFFVWMCLHAIGRLIMEAFRGDPRGPDLLGFSLATWISAALFLGGAWLFFLTQARQSHKPK